MDNINNYSSHTIYGFSPAPTLGSENNEFMQSVINVKSVEIRLMALAEALLLGRELRSCTNGFLRQEGAEAVLKILNNSCDYMIDATQKIKNEDLVKGFNMALGAIKLLTNAYCVEMQK